MFENRFSRRKGYTPAPVQGELEELSDHVRNRLWDVFWVDIYGPNSHYDATWGQRRLLPPLLAFLRLVWTELYRERVDEYPGDDQLLRRLRGDFLAGIWHFPFDIFEAVFSFDAQFGADFTRRVMRIPDNIVARIKDALERENQAYTFVGGLFVERMTPQEVESVETALQSPIEGIRVHFAKALQLYSDRDNPDFPNSIKESISAVEAACRNLTKRENAILPDALKLLDGQRAFHPAFKEALVRLYGWTSDEGGIRHSIKDADKVERSDAQFMLVVCSAFVNYLLTR